MNDGTRISPLFRLALGVKSILLALLAATFACLAVAALLRPWSLALRLAAAALFAFPLPVLAPGAIAAMLDGLLGRARVVAGAVALPSRRAGWSLRMPDGSFAEYVLWNPWRPLVPGRRYTVRVGARSRVLVAEPVEEL